MELDILIFIIVESEKDFNTYNHGDGSSDQRTVPVITKTHQDASFLVSFFL